MENFSNLLISRKNTHGHTKCRGKNDPPKVITCNTITEKCENDTRLYIKQRTYHYTAVWIDHSQNLLNK